MSRKQKQINMNLKFATKLAAFGVIMIIVKLIYDVLTLFEVLEYSAEIYKYIILMTLLPWIFILLFFLSLSKKQK